MEIRDETAADHAETGALITGAFRGHPWSDQREAAILDRLRADGALAFNLVAAEPGGLAGQAAFSPVEIRGAAGRWFALGPIAIRPGRQRQGIGAALIRAGLGRLSESGADGCVLAGDPGYYRRFGFSRVHGLTTAGIPDEYVLALGLGRTVPAGEIVFASAFLTA